MRGRGQGTETWFEWTDHDINDEIEGIHAEIKQLKYTLWGIKDELSALYYKKKSKLYKEGTNEEIKTYEED